MAVKDARDINRDCLTTLVDKYYQPWNKYNVLGVSVELASMPDEEPVLSNCHYDSISDIFNINLKSDTSFHEQYIDENLSLYINEQGLISGLNLYHVKRTGIKQSEQTLKNRVKEYLTQLINSIDRQKDRTEAHRRLGKVDPNVRTLNFIEELTEASLAKL